MQRPDVTHPSAWCKIGETWVGMMGEEVRIDRFEAPVFGGFIIVYNGQSFQRGCDAQEFILTHIPKDPHPYWAKELMKLLPNTHRAAIRDALRSDASISWD